MTENNMTIDLRPWGYAPGFYLFRCIDCEDKSFENGPIGDKRSTRCQAHALIAMKNANTMTIEAKNTTRHNLMAKHEQLVSNAAASFNFADSLLGKLVFNKVPMIIFSDKIVYIFWTSNKFFGLKLLTASNKFEWTKPDETKEILNISDPDPARLADLQLKLTAFLAA